MKNLSGFQNSEFEIYSPIQTHRNYDTHTYYNDKEFNVQKDSNFAPYDE